MIRLLIKKTCYDLWDNIIKISLLNLGFVVITVVPVIIAPVFSFSITLIIMVYTAGLIIGSIYLAAVSMVIRNVSDYGSFGFREFFISIRQSWHAGFAMSFLVPIWFFIFYSAILFSLSMNSFAGLMGAVLLVWFFIAGVLIIQFYFPVFTRMDKRFPGILRKCLFIFLDDPLFSLFCFFYGIFLTGLSLFLALIIPGPAAVMLFLDEALRLIIIKYDYIESHPETDRKKIPWDSILKDEFDRTGTRSFMSFIFPRH